MRPMSSGRSSLVVPAVASVWIIWGSTYLGIEIGLETLPPFFMQGSRFVLASVLVLAWLKWRGTPWPTWRQTRNASVIGDMLLIGGLGLVALAVLYLVTFGSIIAFTAFTYLIATVRPPLAMSHAYVNPLIAVVLGVLFADESVSSNMAVALPVILVGVAIVTNASRLVQSDT